MDKEIILYHQDWYGICKITKNKIKRLTDENETGILNFKKNQIEVNWDKWSTNYFNYIQVQFTKNMSFFLIFIFLILI